MPHKYSNSSPPPAMMVPTSESFFRYSSINSSIMREASPQSIEPLCCNVYNPEKNVKVISILANHSQRLPHTTDGIDQDIADNLPTATSNLQSGDGGLKAQIMRNSITGNHDQTRYSNAASHLLMSAPRVLTSHDSTVHVETRITFRATKTVTYGSLNSPACSCVSITLPGSS